MRLIQVKLKKMIDSLYDGYDYIGSICLNHDDWILLSSSKPGVLDINAVPQLIKVGILGTMYGCTIRLDNRLPSLIDKYQICG